MVSQRKIYTLYDYIQIFLKYKKPIIYFTLSVGIIAAFLLFVVIAPVFLSSATVKSTTKGGGLAGLLSGAGLSGLGDVSDLTGGGAGVTELALYEHILESRRAIEETIIKFNLMDEYNEKYMQDAVKYFREDIMNLSKDKVAGTLTIDIYDEDPVKAKEIVEFLIEKLNKINIELSVQNARNNREFIETRYNLARSDLKNAEDSLKVFQDIYGVAPDITIKAAAQMEIQLEAQIKSEEVKLDLLKKILSPDQAEVKAQEEKISALKKQLFDVQTSSGLESKLNLKGTPDIVINYLRLQREIEIQQKILTFILPMYEQAKIDEKKEMPTVLILDYPNVAERKAKPKRLTLTLIAIVLAFGLSYGSAFVYDKFKDIKENFNESGNS